VLTRFGELNCVVVVIIIDFILLLVKLINVKSEGLLQGNTLDQRGSADQELVLCPAALLPELQPASCFLSTIIGQID